MAQCRACTRAVASYGAFRSAATFADESLCVLAGKTVKAVDAQLESGRQRQADPDRRVDA